MRVRTMLVSVIAVLSLIGVICMTARGEAPAASAPAIEANTLYEITFTAKPVGNPFHDATCQAEFTSPSGKKIAVGGFYYGSEEFRIRFVPREQGTWTWTAELTGQGETSASSVEPRQEKSGGFVCSGVSGHGFLQVSKRNPYRLEYDDGTAFYPIGIQTCSFLGPDFAGEPGQSREGWTDNKTWLKAFAGSVNLVRTQFGQGTTAGCALPLIPGGGDGTVYDTDLAAKIDQAYAQHRAVGISQMLILFQDMSLWGSRPTAFGHGRDLAGYKSVEAPNLPLQEQYIRYIVARWGAFVDVWELYNEDSYSPDDYLAHLAKVVRAADPYGHLVTSTYWRKSFTWSDIVTWHEYMGMPASGVDSQVVSQLAQFKSYGKPVVNTEFGNQGILSNVDPLKWRIATWTAFMNEGSILFWSASNRQLKVGENAGKGNANAYIGPDTRQHLRVLNEFTRDLPIDMRPVSAGYTHNHGDIRAYALSNGAATVVYVHHFSDRAKAHQVAPLLVETGPGEFRYRWINPEDGKEVASGELMSLQQYASLKVPPVTVDLACRIDRVEATSKPAP